MDGFFGKESVEGRGFWGRCVGGDGRVWGGIFVRVADFAAGFASFFRGLSD